MLILTCVPQELRASWEDVMEEPHNDATREPLNDALANATQEADEHMKAGIVHQGEVIFMDYSAFHLSF